jgi:alpha-galactosidase
MLQVGHPALGPCESRTHLILWALMAAPLLAGNDLRTMSGSTRQLLTDPDIIALDQDGSAPASHMSVAGWDVWTRTLASGAIVTAVVNLSGMTRTIPASLFTPGTELSRDGSSDGAVVAGHATRLTITE